MTTSTPDDIVRAIVHLMTGEDDTPYNNVEPGRLLASLNFAEATKFAEIATDLTHNRYSLTYETDGTLRLITTTG